MRGLDDWIAGGHYAIHRDGMAVCAHGHEWPCVWFEEYGGALCASIAEGGVPSCPVCGAEPEEYR